MFSTNDVSLKKIDIEISVKNPTNTAGRGYSFHFESVTVFSQGQVGSCENRSNSELAIYTQKTVFCG